MKRIVLIITVIILLFMFTGCVPNNGIHTIDKPAGFWWGLWHGMISTITFFMGVFTGGKYTIYESINTGWGYNLGFLIGIGSFWSGSSKATNKSS